MSDDTSGFKWEWSVFDQHGQITLSLVGYECGSVGPLPEHAWSLVLFDALYNKTCPHEEWQDSTSDVRGDITMLYTHHTTSETSGTDAEHGYIGNSGVSP